jgi:2-amino-4-hydroxy-6-hydroxymethyldihydropteridine diphosphokinase
MFKTALIGTGSNLGDREQQLRQALQWTAEEVGEIVRTSALYQTSPWGNIDQPDYLNQVWQIRTSLEPFRLMEKLLELEKRAKRERKEKWGARTLDLDLLFYEDYIIRTDALELPHPRLHLRNFVLIPLEEIAPEWEHPVFKKTIAQLREESQDEEEVRVWGGE